MKLITIKRQHDHGNPYIEGHRFEDTYELEVGWNRIKLNFTQLFPYGGFVTWYPFSFYWWPPNNQWFRWRILGLHLSKPPTIEMIGR